MFKWFILMTGFLVSIFGIPHSQAQVLHQVAVVDHEFQPRNLTISEGDTVRWEWKGDLHNVVAVTLPGGGVKSGAFESELLNTNASFEVEFSRELLNQYSRDSGVFGYVCEPHAFFGMHGTVSVTRIPKFFVGTASAWQAGGTGSEVFNIVAELSDNERTLQLSVPGAGNALTFDLRDGGVGEVGVSLCSGSIEPGAVAQCTIEDSNLLFQGNLFVILDSRLRAQLVRKGVYGAISGRVRGADGKAISGVTVSTSGLSVQSDATGNYRLESIPFGVHQLSASYGGVTFSEAGWSNPVLLITTELYQRDFETKTGVPGSVPVPAPTTGDVCTGIREQLSSLAPAFYESFDIGIKYLVEDSLLDFLRTHKMKVRAKILHGATFEDTDRDGILPVTMAQGKGSGKIEVLSSEGAEICKEKFTVVIESPLNTKNLYKVKQYLVLATVNARQGVTFKGFLKEASALLSDMAAGGAENPRYPGILSRRLVRRFSSELNRIRKTRESKEQRLSQFLEKVESSIQLLEERDRLKASGHASHRSAN